MMSKITLLALTAASAVLAQRPNDTSICDYYTTALLKNNTAKNQYTLLTLVVNTAVIGNCEHTTQRRHHRPRHPRPRRIQRHRRQPPPLLQRRAGLLQPRRLLRRRHQLPRRRRRRAPQDQQARHRPSLEPVLPAHAPVPVLRRPARLLAVRRRRRRLPRLRRPRLHVRGAPLHGARRARGRLLRAAGRPGRGVLRRRARRPLRRPLRPARHRDRRPGPAPAGHLHRRGLVPARRRRRLRRLCARRRAHAREQLGRREWHGRRERHERAKRHGRAKRHEHRRRHSDRPWRRRRGGHYACAGRGELRGCQCRGGCCYGLRGVDWLSDT